MSKFSFDKSAGDILGIDIPVPSREEIAERKRFATLCGHVKRKLRKNERLTGDVLECALNSCDGETAEKLKRGEPLGDYEKHLIVDVVLLHQRLS